jgi:hypothetical protein
LGNILYKKFGRICDALQTIIDSDQLQLDETTVRENIFVLAIILFVDIGKIFGKRIG